MWLQIQALEDGQQKEKELREKDIVKEKELREKDIVKERELREKDFVKEKELREKDIVKERELREKDIVKERELREKDMIISRTSVFEKVFQVAFGAEYESVRRKVVQNVEKGLEATEDGNRKNTGDE
jgi:hypothetical protein